MRHSHDKPKPIRYGKKASASVAKTSQGYRTVLKEYGLDFVDFQRCEKIFSAHGIDICITFGVTRSGKKGKPYLTFEKAGKKLVMDAGIAGQCIGFIFATPHESSIEIRRRRKDASGRLKRRESLKRGDFLIFNVDVFEEILKVLSMEYLSQVLRINTQKFIEHNNDLKQYGRQFKLEYIGNNPILVFNDTELGLLTNLGFSKIYTNSVGFIFRNPGEKDAQFNTRRDYAEDKYSDLLNKDIFLIEYSLLKFNSFMDALPKRKKRSIKRRNSQEVTKKLSRLQGQVSRFLNKNLTSDTAVVEAKKVMSKREGDEVLSRSAKFPKVDIIFSNKGKGNLQFQYLNLIGWKFPLKEKEGTKPSETISYNNVCGVIIVDDSMSSSDRKKLCRIARAQLATYYPIQPSSVVMAVDSRLFKLWKKQGAESSEIVANSKKVLKDRKTEYGTAPAVLKNISPKRVDAYVYEPEKSHIGGTQISVNVDYGNGHSKSVILDYGWIFDLNKTWNGIGQGPSYVDGIQPFLAGGMWGLNPRAYRTDLLMNSFRPDIITALSNPGSGAKYKSANEFIGLELYHRLGREGFENLMREHMPSAYSRLKRRSKLSKNGFWNPLKEREAQMYADKDILLMLLLSHAHQDHAIGSSIIRDAVIRGMSPATRAILLSDHKISSNWLVQDTAARKMRELPKVGASFPVFEYPYQLFNGSGERVEIAEGIYISSFGVEHSIPGALAFKVEVEHKGKLLASIIHPGDYKNGDIFQKFGDSGRVDLMFAEGTNPPGAKKDSTSHTEASVKEKMAGVVIEANGAKKLLIIDLVKNNFERLNNIIDEATARGRTIVISPRIAQRCQFIELMQRRVHSSRRVKVPDFNRPNIKIWKRNMRTHGPEHVRMFNQYGAINQDALSTNPQQYVLIREGHERPEKVTGIMAPSIWIRSVYGDYEASSRRYTKECQKIAKRKGWDLRREGYHATGHGPLLNSSHPNSADSILGQMHKAKAKKIAIIHTQKRKLVAQTMSSYSELRKAEIIWQISHPKKVGDKGHRIPVWTK